MKSVCLKSLQISMYKSVRKGILYSIELLFWNYSQTFIRKGEEKVTKNTQKCGSKATKFEMI